MQDSKTRLVLLCSTTVIICTLTHHRYIFWFLVDCCITNAFILARECRPAGCGARMDLKSFRIQLAQGLIGGYNSRKRYSLPAAVYEVALYQSFPPSGRRGGDPAVSSTRHFPLHSTKGRSVQLLLEHQVQKARINRALPAVWSVQLLLEHQVQKARINRALPAVCPCSLYS